MTCNGSREPDGLKKQLFNGASANRRPSAGPILLYVTKKGDLAATNNHIAHFAHGGVVVGPWRGHIGGWSGGAVFAAWPSREKLAEIADDYRTRALCVISWAEEETTAWEQATHPKRLAGASAATS